MRVREVGKFLSGIAADQALTHGVFAAGGHRYTLLGVSFDPQINAAATAAWTVALIALIYFAWLRRGDLREQG